MKPNSARFLPIVIALGLSFGVAVAQTYGGSGTTSSGGSAGSGSSMSGGGAAPAAQPGTATRSAGAKGEQLARADRKFIQDAAEAGLFEVEAAQLASSKASSPDVKGFATTLVKDHTNANNELVQLANSKKVELPAAPPRAKRNDIEKMGKLSGTDFDQRFVREVGIRDHQKDIKDFENASKKVKDPELKAWVDKTLPTLREHLAMAQKLPQGGAAAMGNKGAAAPATTGPYGGKSGS